MQTVSVIIPTFNRKEQIGRAIRSVLNQIYQDFEIIVVDDCSTDNTEEVVKSFRDNRIICISHDRNRGGSASRNTGIRASRGKYVAFLDSDDEWLPEKLNMQMTIFRDDPDCGAVYTDIQHVHGNNSLVVHHRSFSEKNLLRELLISNVIGTASSVVVRRECFDTLGLFDEELPSCQDWDMWIRIATRYRFRRVPVPLVIYHLDGVRISKDSNAVRIGHELITLKHKEILRKAGREVEAAHHFVLGNKYCHWGDTVSGRKHLWIALRTYPFNIKHILYFFFACFGAGVYRRAINLKRFLALIVSKHNSSSSNFAISRESDLELQ